VFSVNDWSSSGQMSPLLLDQSQKLKSRVSDVTFGTETRVLTVLYSLSFCHCVSITEVNNLSILSLFCSYFPHPTLSPIKLVSHISIRERIWKLCSST